MTMLFIIGFLGSPPPFLKKSLGRGAPLPKKKRYTPSQIWEGVHPFLKKFLGRGAPLPKKILGKGCTPS